jgi:predicted oxidoreductase
VLLALGEDLPRLHLVYGLTPLVVAFFAEQLRAVSAQTELDRRDLAGRDDVARLSETDQRLLVEAIVRREIGVMAASALVVAGLGVRASGWF